MVKFSSLWKIERLPDLHALQICHQLLVTALVGFGVVCNWDE